MIPEREREALMRLTMCARGYCCICKYKEECDEDAKDERITKNMNILADALRKTEPTISNMEQVEWTKEDCKGCKYNEYPYDSGTCFVRVCINGNKYEPKDEPQTERSE